MHRLICVFVVRIWHKRSSRDVACIMLIFKVVKHVQFSVNVSKLCVVFDFGGCLAAESCLVKCRFVYVWNAKPVHVEH